MGGDLRTTFVMQSEAPRELATGRQAVHYACATEREPLGVGRGRQLLHYVCDAEREFLNIGRGWHLAHYACNTKRNSLGAGLEEGRTFCIRARMAHNDAKDTR